MSYTMKFFSLSPSVSWSVCLPGYPAWIDLKLVNYDVVYTCMESMMMVKIYGHLLVSVVILMLHVHINAIITLK